MALPSSGCGRSISLKVPTETIRGLAVAGSGPSGLPPAVVVLAGTIRFATKACSMPSASPRPASRSELVEFPDMAHGFFSLTESLDAAAEAQARVAAALTGVFGGSLPQPT